MPIRVEISQVIDRPLEKVFHFVAREHVRNHPRRDAPTNAWHWLQMM